MIPEPWPRRGRRRLGAVLLAAWLAILPAWAAGAAPGPGGPTVAPARSRDEVFYQIFLRSFCDSNGDRIGDLPGVQAHLGYLHSLGVTSILLTPIQPSPFYHNYFADRFEGIDPAYGTMDDFHALVRAVHARGMKLFLDEEIQYVTENHPWLRQALGHPDSPFSHYLLFNGPDNSKPESLFPGLPTLPGYDGRKIEVATVNLLDPDVRGYFEKRFVSWIDPAGDGSLRDGVDGFRIDHMMDDLDNKGKLTGLFANFWRPIFAAVRARNPRARIIAEQADWGYGDDFLKRGGVDMVFAFPLRQAIASFDPSAIVAAIRETEARTPPGKAQLTFIENHDVERFASVVDQNPAKERIGAAFDILLRGTPLIYYGQELGMRGIQHRAWGSDANDIPVREAFRWTHDLEAPGSAIWYRGPHPWWTDRFNRSNDGVSVEEEAKNPDSLLNFYRRLLRIRAARPEIQTGRQLVLDPASARVVCFLRAQGAARTLVALNLAATPAKVIFRPDEAAAAGLNGRWVDLLHDRRPVDPQKLELAPFEVLVAGTP
jgi:alpha-amylase